MSKNEIVASNPFKAKFGDRFYFFAQTILVSLMPQAALPLAILQMYIGTPAARRAEKFILSLNERLEKLEFNPKELLNDPKFQSFVITAVQIAVKTHQDEKLEALRNAVTNSIYANSPEEDTQFMYLRIIDAITPFDLKILEEFYNDRLFDQSHLRSDNEEYLKDQSLRFLKANGLISEWVQYSSNQWKNIGSPVSETKTNMQNSFGYEFLKFIGITVRIEEAKPPKI